MEKNEILKKDYIELLSDIYGIDLKDKVFDIPLIFITKEKMEADKLKIPRNTSKIYRSLKDYLLRLK